MDEFLKKVCSSSVCASAIPVDRQLNYSSGGTVLEDNPNGNQ